MPAREVTCRSCGAQVFEVPGYWNNTMVVEKGKIEVAYLVPQVQNYATQEGFKIHKCKPKENVNETEQRKSPAP